MEETEIMQVSDSLVTTQHHLAPLSLCNFSFAMGWGFRFEDAMGGGGLLYDVLTHY